MMTENSPVLDCGESGTTLRLLLPLTAVIANGRATFVGHGRLPDRPNDELMGVMTSRGASFSSNKLPFTVSGKLHGGKYLLPGNVSSQYISGLLLALPLLSEDSDIVITTELQSEMYVKMTLDTLDMFGVRWSFDFDGVKPIYHIFGCQSYTRDASEDIAVEGDWSSAAFFLAANALGGGVQVAELNVNSSQGDMEAKNLLASMSERVSVKNIPDLFPILAVRAAFLDTDTVFTNIERLRLKESDRVESVCSLIKSLGGKAVADEQTVTIRGGGLRGGDVNGFNDHRIVMAAAIAAAYSTNGAVISNAECVAKSYPKFWEDFVSLGGGVQLAEDT